MAFHETLITDRQMVTFMSPSMQTIEESRVDTWIVHDGGKTHYMHRTDGEVAVLGSKKALRKILGQESGGAWCEEIEGKKRYFVEKRGWLSSEYREVNKEECLKHQEKATTFQKVLGIGMGMLSLAPVATELARSLPCNTLRNAAGLVAAQQKNAFMGMALLSTSVHAQVVDHEFRINTYTDGTQGPADVDGLLDGGFVVVWSSLGQDGSQYGIYAQRFDFTGREVGVEFQANNYTERDQVAPNVEGLESGGFIIGWHSGLQDGDVAGVYGQMYDLDSSNIGYEFQINTYTPGSQTFPKIAALKQGGYAIIWLSRDQDGSLHGVYGKVYAPNGTAITDEFQINTYTPGSQNYLSVAEVQDGGFVAAWSSEGQDGNLRGVYAQKHFANGSVETPEFQVNTYTIGDQLHTAVTGLVDGRFVVIWSSRNQDGNNEGLYGQLFEPNGTKYLSEFQINTYTVGPQYQPSVAGVKDGSFVATWRSNGQDGDQGGIFAQHFHANGTRLREEFQVNSFSSGSQRDPSIAALEDGGFVIVWASENQDGTALSVYGKRYNATGSAIGLINVTTPSLPSTSLMHSELMEYSSSTIEPSELQENTSSMVHSTSSQSSNSSLVQSSLEPSMQSNMPVLIEIEYGHSYEIFSNDIVIGNFHILGGEGLYQHGNSNTLVIEFNGNYYPSDGETLVLFTDVPEDQVLELDIEFVNGDGECFTAEGVFRENESGGNDYTLLFGEDSTCELALEASHIAPFATLLAIN